MHPNNKRAFDDGIGKPADVPDWNPDAKILAARGVKTLEELNEKYEYGVPKAQQNKIPPRNF